MILPFTGAIVTAAESYDGFRAIAFGLPVHPRKIDQLSRKITNVTYLNFLSKSLFLLLLKYTSHKFMMQTIQGSFPVNNRVMRETKWELACNDLTIPELRVAR